MMSDWNHGDWFDDIYICVYCGYPIIFRYMPPQVFHLGTGWPCWRKRKEEEEGPQYVNIRQHDNTPPDLRMEYLEQARQLFQPFVQSGDAAPLLDVLMNHLEDGRGDVIGDVLAFLARCEDTICNYMICIIVANLSWQEFVDGLIADARKRYRRQKSVERRKLKNQLRIRS